MSVPAVIASTAVKSAGAAVKGAGKAAGTAYRGARTAYQKEERLFNWSEVVILAAVCGFAYYRYRHRYIRKSSEGTGRGTTSSTGFNPDALAAEIKEKIEGYNLYVYPELAQDILSLTDEDLEILYYHYNEYYAEEYPTLTQLFDAEWDTWDGDYAHIVTRLEGMGLYEGPQVSPMVVLILTHRLKAMNCY